MKIKFLFLVLLFSNSAYSSYKLETVLDDLDDAWSLVFLSEDKILFTEMSGKLKVASLSDKSVNEIDNVPLVQYSGQGGLSDVALDPDFESNNMIYLTYLVTWVE